MPRASSVGALREEHGRLDDDTVADHRDDVAVQDAARDELEGEGLAVHDDRVAGVVAALVAHDEVHVLGEEVGELALSLVTPLGSDHHGRGHVTPPEFLRELGRSPWRSSLRALARAVYVFLTLAVS